MEIRKSIEVYLSKMKDNVRKGQYRIEWNSKRESNQQLTWKYVISEKIIEDILLSLTPKEFCKMLRNEHIGFEHEMLYVFGKEVTLLEKFGSGEKTVSLYIKLNNLENYLIVVSFHEQKYPLTYFFASEES